MAEPAFYSRLERLAEVDSTQRVVRQWLAEGAPEVLVATADHQTAGRGRHGRGWQAPPGAALLLSAGFRPAVAVEARHAWRVAATVALAMLDAAEDAAGLRDDTLWLKWPNDIVVEASDGLPRKVAGVLGEGLPAAEFPLDLRPIMTSLREVANGRPVDREQLLQEFLARLEPRYLALRDGHFDAGGWSRRQLTTGRLVEVATGERTLNGRAAGVDPETGALLLDGPDGRRSIGSGEVVRCRLLAELPRR